MAPYPSAAIANRFLDLAKSDGKALTQMQIQKLVYFAHGWHLAFYDEPLCTNHAQAWQWGPVFPDLYHATKQFGNSPISTPVSAEEDVVNAGRIVVEKRIVTISPQDEGALALIQRVWDEYGGFSAARLSRMSHDAKGPWHFAREGSDYSRGVDITNKSIKKYFKGLMSDDE